MASSFGKDFKATETTKAAGAEVVSEPILLSPRTTDHVLTVTVPSSLSGDVDVELEMSPDNQNWCPAVTKTTTVTSGSPTEAQVGNQKYTKLTPDTVDGVTEAKNKHARGLMEYDLNFDRLYEGNQSDEEQRTDAADFMHHRLAANKSFNYSQWFKTSEAPTTTYKPVLFRHGGYDDFENLKVVETDSNTTTQNLSKEISEDKAMETFGYSTTNNGNDYITGQGFELTASSGTHINPFKVNSNIHSSTTSGYYTDTTYLPDIYLNSHDNSGFTITAQVKFNGISNCAQEIARINLANGEYVRCTAQIWTGKLSLYAYISYNQGANEYVFGKTNFTATSNTWYHVGFRFLANPTGSSNQYYMQFGLDGNGYIASYTNSSYNMSTSLVNNTTHSSSAVSSVEICNNRNGYGGNNPTKVDNLCFYYGSPYDGSSNRWDLIYAARNNPTASPSIGGCRLTACFKMGDGPQDTLSPIAIKDIVEPSSNRQITPTSTSTGSLVTLTSADDPYVIQMDQFPAIFDASASSSISGWFKTTDTGTLFSNTGGAAATGLKVDVSGSAITASYLSSSLSTSVTGTFNDGEWHHIVMVLSSGSQLIVVDNTYSQASNHTLVDDDLRGTNGFTLLGDGQENAGNPSAASTDASKLAATLSNWSLHTEAIGTTGISQLYSNGHVRNIKNLPSVTSTSISNWWKFSSTTNPEEDSVGLVSLDYQDGSTPPAALTTKVIDATGAAKVEDSINGNAMTLSLTKSFNFTTNEWVATADQDTALCLSFNGFEEQAEYFALWKCSQVVGGVAIDICDGGWHNVILSYRGNNDLAGNNVVPGTDVVKFGPGPANNLPFHWAVAFDGIPLTAINAGSGVDYVGGLNTISTDTYSGTTYNVGFVIENRHLKYQSTNNEEVYKPHAQFSAGIHEVTGIDNNNAFQGAVDETSFHTDCWWVNSAADAINQTTYNSGKATAIYGNTQALSNRGTGSDYPEGVPYPLNDPSAIGATAGVDNQYVNPNRYDAATNPNGGLEAWWRWGDTLGDCEISINDVKDTADSTEGNAINDHDLKARFIVTEDAIDMSVLGAESIFKANVAASSGTGSVSTTFSPVIIEGIQQGVCNIADIKAPLLQFLRVKWKGEGSVDLGEDAAKAKLYFTHRRKRK